MSERRGNGDARGRALGYLAAEAAMGRGRVVLPGPLPAPSAGEREPEQSLGRSEGPRSQASRPDPAPPGAGASGELTPSGRRPAAHAAAGSPPRKSSAPPTEAPAAGEAKKATLKTFGPLENVRSAETVAAVADALAPIDARAQVCTACELSRTRKSVVFGTGTGRSGIVLVGEAPGASEDEQGVPFVGRAGQLLDKILAAIGVARDDVYICNVLKCRPPGNRDPKPMEAALCAPFLNEQLEALRPRVICALGLHAARRLLEVTMPMARLRGQVLSYRGIPTIATYHPAALLRNPSLKRPAWEDFQLLRKLAEESDVE
jgi:DNA polymerase